TGMGPRGAATAVPSAGDPAEREGAPTAEVTQAAATVGVPGEKALRVVRTVPAEAPAGLARTAALPAWAEPVAAAWVVRRRWAAPSWAKAFHSIRRTYFLLEMTCGTSDTSLAESWRRPSLEEAGRKWPGPPARMARGGFAPCRS